MAEQLNDPYAPPPMKHDNSGAVVRIIAIGALLAAGVWGFTAFSSGRADIADIAPVEQQMADAGPIAVSDTPPLVEAAPEPIEPAAPAPAPRRAERAPAPEPVTPAPVTTPAPETTPDPVSTAPKPETIAPL
jgi:hypothetical protein